MEKATPVQMRKALEVVEQFKSAGILFMPIPILNDADELYADLMRRLDVIEAESKDI